jgi:hypothetical protein
VWKDPERLRVNMWDRNPSGVHLTMLMWTINWNELGTMITTIKVNLKMPQRI